MEWNNKYSVGITSIDDQHKQLISLINNLSEAMAKGQGNDVLEKIFDEIIKYTATHFSFEEKLFETHGFPGGATHKAEHAALVKQALELQEKYRKGSIAISVTTQNFLTDWLKKHIMGTDKEYTAFLVSKGVK